MVEPVEQHRHRPPRPAAYVVLLVMLVAVAGLLTWAVVPAAHGSASAEDAFWAYVSSRAQNEHRRSAVEFGRALCGDPPVSDVELRNAQEFIQPRDSQTVWGVAPRSRSEALALRAVLDAAFTYLCPVTKHLPANPRHDPIAGFPLPRGAVLDDDPVLARADDDPGDRDDDDPNYRNATYLVPARMTFEAVGRFLTAHVQAGASWRGWSWCRTTSEDDPPYRSETYEWQRDGRRLDLTWAKAHDDLVHVEGTRLISVDDFAAVPQTPPCTGATR